MVTEAILALLVLVGGAFTLVGSIGLWRLPDFMTRLHAPTKATTVGVGAVVIAALLHRVATTGDVGIRELAISLFLFITAPVTAHMLSKVALKPKASAK